VLATQFNFCSALDFVYPEPFPQQPRNERNDTKFRELRSSVSMSRELKKIEELKQPVEYSI